MSNKPANKGDRGHALTGRTIRRIGRAVNAYERGDRDVPGRRFRRGGGGGGSYAVVLGKTTNAWNKDTAAEITVYDAGQPLDEIPSVPATTIPDVVNKFANVGADKWVMLAEATNGEYYLIAAEC